METSSFQLQATDKFKPFISVFLNVSPNHLDHHKDFDEYFHSKTNIFKNQTSDDWAIINSGDENIKKCAGDIKSEIIGFGNGSDIENIVLNSRIVEFRNEKYDLSEMKLIGEHNLDNAMCAIAVSKIAGSVCLFCARYPWRNRVAFSPSLRRIDLFSGFGLIG